MKKLIVGLFAVALALGAQAAATSWAFSAYLEDAEGMPLEGTLYFYLDDVSIGSAIIGEKDYATAEANLTVDVGTVKVVADITNFSDGEGTLEWTRVITSIPFSGDPDPQTSMVNLTQEVQMGVLNDGNIILSEGIAANGYSPAAPVIPEPTTGLLVLLGVAGLALRRRRA